MIVGLEAVFIIFFYRILSNFHSTNENCQNKSNKYANRESQINKNR
jgi:hypothetical protein